MAHLMAPRRSVSDVLSRGAVVPRAHIALEGRLHKHRCRLRIQYQLSRRLGLHSEYDNTARRWCTRYLQVAALIEEVCQLVVSHADALLDQVGLVPAQLRLQPVLGASAARASTLSAQSLQEW